MKFSYRSVMWMALGMLVVQTAYYNLYIVPRYNELMGEYARYVEHLEWLNDGCYEVKYQLLEELDNLSPTMKSPQYTMRFRIQ